MAKTNQTGDNMANETKAELIRTLKDLADRDFLDGSEVEKSIRAWKKMSNAQLRRLVAENREDN